MISRLQRCFPYIALLGCGRPATEEDCRVLIEKTAKFEVSQAPSGTSATKDPWLSTHEQTLIRGCVGKSVTQEFRPCIDRAASSQELDRCLR